MRKLLITIGVIILLGAGCQTANQSFGATSCLNGQQGGTGVCTATSSNIGQVLTVSSTASGLIYKFSTPASSGGGSGSVGTSTSGYFSFYSNQNSVIGTPVFTFDSSTLALSVTGTAAVGDKVLRIDNGGFYWRRTSGDAVEFYDTTSGATSNNAQIYVNAANGKQGFLYVGGSDMGIGTYSTAHPIYFYTGNSIRLILNGSNGDFYPAIDNAIYSGTSTLRYRGVNTYDLSASGTSQMVTTTVTNQLVVVSSTAVSSAEIFRAGSALFVDNTPGNSCVGINAQSCPVYATKRFALTVNAYDNYGAVVLMGQEPLIKFKGAYNAGNGAEQYQNTVGNYYFNVNASISSYILFPDGSAQFVNRSGARLSIGNVLPASGLGKLYIRSDNTAPTDYIMYAENSSGSGPAFSIDNTGGTRMSSSLKVATLGSITGNGLFFVDSSGNVSASGTAFTYGTSTYAASLSILGGLTIGSNTSTPVVSANTSTIRNGLLGKKAGCIANVDVNKTSITYCTTQSGVMSCSTSSCE